MTVINSTKLLLDYIYTALITPWLISQFLFDITLCLIPYLRPSRQWSLNQAARVRLIRLVLLYWSLTKYGDRLRLDPKREKNRFEVVSPRSPKLYRGVLSDYMVQPAQLGMTWTPSRPPPAGLINSGMVVVLHFHGGGYVIGNGRDEDTGFLAKTLVRHLGCTHVCTPQYRLSSSSNGHFPAPLQDALTAYLDLIKTKGIPANQIILSGDSAGANLALALVRYIHEYGRTDDIPFPRAMALWSPWVDIAGALEQDVKQSPNYKTDYLNMHFARWGAATISGYGVIDPAGPYLSPLRNLFELEESLPVYVNAGGGEVLRNDIENFCQRYEKHGWNIHLDVSEGCPHDILLLGDTMGFGAEAKKAAENARRFLTVSAGLKLQSYVPREL
jgi:acetyl esterase/lipase